MSLLMDALKKSERAKQKQDGQASETLAMLSPSENPSEEPGLPPRGDSPPRAEEKREGLTVVEDDKPIAIPELTLLSSSATADLSLSAEPVPVMQCPEPAPCDNLEMWVDLDANAKAADSSRQLAPEPERKPDLPAPDDKKVAEARQKAKSIFTAKQPARNNVRLLTGAVAAIALVITFSGIYYFISSSTSTPPPPMPPQVAIQTPPPADTVAVDTPAVNMPASNNLTPGKTEPLPPAANVAPAPTIPAPPKLDTAASAKAIAASAPPPWKKPASVPQPANPAIQIRQSKATHQLNPMISKAYQSFLAGDIDTAQQQYSQALQQEANNRDALLGLAATALARKQPEQATAYYAQLLELSPTDPEAMAGLVGLQGQTDPVQGESNLKKLLLQNPQSAALHFALGNMYTKQSRWAEAQQSYFRAYSNAPNNADYAFNLAISLDHLGQSKLALDYYQRALSQSGPANFDQAAARIRILELQQPAGN
ncbi:MAG: hypothetical protein A2505_06490 [Deltaproteobacteria bacterium RIFOXYD12_FULL_55_16]|nr:MAG: hypothetical protein A2505_06490 [Deltaproteobacteria bacterium RIFOXYD12_FULL_55_16]